MKEWAKHCSSQNLNFCPWVCPINYAKYIAFILPWACLDPQTRSSVTIVHSPFMHDMQSQKLSACNCSFMQNNVILTMLSLQNIVASMLACANRDIIQQEMVVARHVFSVIWTSRALNVSTCKLDAKLVEGGLIRNPLRTAWCTTLCTFQTPFANISILSIASVCWTKSAMFLPRSS